MSASQAKVISVSLPSKIVQRVDAVARAQDRSRSKVIAHVLHSWLSSSRAARPPQETA